ncbi:hypothetical protein LCGC14_2922600 [marine sediment metagenome]|uniref:Uncharacterized protein n=1 Tax=marine sediment metagenome TaxID=412755 RepID=A0A0F8ZVZ7_9ZZZZ
MIKRRKRRVIIHVTNVNKEWYVEVEWPFKVRGVVASNVIATYKRQLHASNLADRLEGELQDAEIVIHD